MAAKLNFREDDDDYYSQASLEHYREARKDLDGLAAPRSTGKQIHPQYVVKTLNELAAASWAICFRSGN